MIPILAGEGAFGTGFAGDVVPLVAEMLAPLGFGFGDFVGHGVGHFSS
jgi:hypothetical protein